MAKVEMERLLPAGVCPMGDFNVTYYKRGNRLWFDKKGIEFVLTGKNQHNLLGQYKDPKNHMRIFDTQRNEVVDIISKTGIHNYLKKAWSVKDENRHAFYAGVKYIETKRESKISEPLQMPLTEATEEEKPQEQESGFTIIIEKKDERVEVVHRGIEPSEIVKVLLGIAQEMINGNYQTEEKND